MVFESDLQHAEDKQEIQSFVVIAFKNDRNGQRRCQVFPKNMNLRQYWYYKLTTETALVKVHFAAELTGIKFQHCLPE